MKKTTAAPYTQYQILCRRYRETVAERTGRKPRAGILTVVLPDGRIITTVDADQLSPELANRFITTTGKRVVTEEIRNTNGRYESKWGEGKAYLDENTTNEVVQLEEELIKANDYDINSFQYYPFPLPLKNEELTSVYFLIADQNEVNLYTPYCEKLHQDFDKL